MGFRLREFASTLHIYLAWPDFDLGRGARIYLFHFFYLFFLSFFVFLIPLFQSLSRCPPYIAFLSLLSPPSFID